MMSNRKEPSSLTTRGLIIALVLTLSGCQSAPILEPEPIGQVSRSIGFPVVNRNNQKYILAPQSIIYASDIFDTNESSMVEISLQDNTIITAGNRSHFSLHDHIQNGDSFLTSLTLTKGSIRAIISTKGSLELRTPLAVAQLESGDMYASFRSNTLEIMVAERGTVTVRNDDGSVSIFAPRSGTTVIAGSAPQAPYELPLSKLERAIKSITIK